MQTTTRLLLPFTEEINAQALDYAIQLAEQRGAILVPLALVIVKPGRGPRLELIQQAQDFLVMIQRKAARHAVPVQSSQVYTQDIARSIEAFTSEMRCGAVILFLSSGSRALLGHAEIQTLIEHGKCNMHIVLLPGKRGRKTFNQPVQVPLFKHSSGEISDTRLLEQEHEHVSLIQRLIHR